MGQERNKSDGERCGDCKHLITCYSSQATYPRSVLYRCGHWDSLELDSNAPARGIGFIDVRPDWCPLRELRQRTINKVSEIDIDDVGETRIIWIPNDEQTLLRWSE